MDELVLERVRDRYAKAATSADGCCDSSCCDPADERFGAIRYDEGDTVGDGLDDAALASLGCGNPTAVAELLPGERVLDLGSGAGLDVLLSGRRVGPEGHVYGLDMTDEMLARARANAEAAGATNVEFLKGYIEAVPLPDDAVDVIISNCVINLSTDKPAVFAEMARVVRPGGRLGITDVVAEDHLSAEERVERGSWVGCIAGALSFTEYRELLATAGFEHISITSTHAVADGMHSAIVKAVRV